MTDPEREALRTGDWGHAKWCRWERVEEGGECNCGLDSFRAALSPEPEPVAGLPKRSSDALIALGDLLIAEHGESCDCDTCLVVQPLVYAALGEKP